MRYEGNIYRPPNEWRSYLLQVTIGCSHNACTFCGMFKDKKYRVRPLGEILEDIAMARQYYGGRVERVFLCDGDAISLPTEELLTILRALTDRECLEETRALMLGLDLPKLHFSSIHASNYVPLQGTLPDDRDKLLKTIDEALSGQRDTRPEFARGL